MRQVETAHHAESFIEDVGFAAGFTDSRRPGPSLFVAVCGRRDALLPRNVQKNPETSLTWQLKDELIERGHVYYAKLSRGKRDAGILRWWRRGCGTLLERGTYRLAKELGISTPGRRDAEDQNAGW